jgi:hypothetical protein
MRSQCLAVCSSRTFGFVPKCAIKRDILCIPLGCLSPLVPGPCGNYDAVIREEYIHGFINGEAPELLRIGDLKVQDFEFH